MSNYLSSAALRQEPLSAVAVRNGALPSDEIPRAAAPPPNPELAHAMSFFGALFAPGDHVLIRQIESWTESDGRRSQTDFRASGCRTMPLDARDVEAMLAHSARRYTNVYVGVCPRVGLEGYDKAWQIRAVRALWTDIDDRQPDRVAESVAMVGLPAPSIVVGSGYGTHLYWLLAEPYLIDDVGPPPQVQVDWADFGERRLRIESFVDPVTGERIDLTDRATGRALPQNRPPLSPKALRIDGILRGIARAIGGDHAYDLARMLRLPGSANRKDQRNGRLPVPCAIHAWSPQRYAIDEFERFVATRSPVVAVPVAGAPRRTVRLSTGQRETLDRLIETSRTARVGTRSGHDYGLCLFAIRVAVDRESLREMVVGVGKFAEDPGYYDRTYSAAERQLQSESQAGNPSPNSDPVASATDAPPPGAPPVDDPRPMILVTADIHEVVDASLRALSAADDVFQRGTQLVQIVRGVEMEAGAALGAARARIMPLESDVLRVELPRQARFQRAFRASTVDVPPPIDVARALARRGEWAGVRPLTGISTSPMIRRDCTILDRPGYDPATGLLYEPDRAYPAVPTQPTLDELQTALAWLWHVIQDFPFAAQEHAATWLAAVLTPIARHAFEGPAPLFAVDGNVRGSGKSLLMEVAARIATGRGASRIANADDAEWRKRILAIAVAGDPVVAIDNVVGEFGGDSLDAALTATRWQDRELGTSVRVEVPLLATWFATGNNLSFRGDTARRVAPIRLESPLERPDERQGFVVADLLGFVDAHLATLRVAALTLLRGWYAAGCPQSDLPPWGSYEGWSRIVRQVVVWCGLLDPARARLAIRDVADPEAQALGSMIAAWPEIDPRNAGATAAEIVE